MTSTQEKTLIDPRLQTLTLLYVEDEEKVRENVLSYLEKRFKTVHTAVNGAEGLAKYNELNPDIVLTDIKMPVMDGLEMARIIREDNKDVPIIITTAFTNEEFYLQSIEIGINKYIKKPIRYPELADAFAKAADIIQPEVREAETSPCGYMFSFFDKAPEPIIIASSDEINYMNKKFLEFTGYASLQEFLASGVAVSDIIKFSDTKSTVCTLEGVCEAGEQICTTVHATLCNRNGNCGNFSVSVSRLARMCKFIIMFRPDANFS